MVEFLLGAAVISLSGVMMPGPMSAVTAGRGSTDPGAGALVAAGHGAVEIPLIILYYSGLGAFGAAVGGAGRTVLGAAGGIVIVFMALRMIAGRAAGAGRDVTRHGNAFTDGVILTAANPYFYLWWISVGGALVARASGFGTAGLGAFITVHWLCDLGWSWTLSALSYRGTRFFGRSFQKGLFIVMGMLLLFFGARFLYDAVISARALVFPA